ncbi:MAG: isoprenyl transferase [Pseudomonadota bacterium]
MSADAASVPPDPVQTDPADVPEHLAIIMDGNGRWAQSRGLPRTAGHERGVEALRRTVDAAGELGVRYLTVFSFSTENWRRPAAEVSMLFGLLRAYVRRDLKRLKAEGVRIRIIGLREGVPEDIAVLIEQAERETAENSRFHLTIAFNYGGRDEIIRAAQMAAAEAARGNLRPEDIDEKVFEGFLDTSGLPDPDMLIRTSGECRLSNFLLWQLAYAEFLFMDVYWPDFGKKHLLDAIDAYAKRNRRYGGLKQLVAGRA